MGIDAIEAYLSKSKEVSKVAYISQSKYRSLLSDVLPYERPIFFSNRSFARFLKHYGVRTEDGRLIATKNQEEGLDEFLRILGGKKGDKRISFKYTISRGENSDKVRDLYVIHPYYQVAMAEFYEEYRMLLIDFCNRSKSSLRYPVRVAKQQKRANDIEKVVFDRVNKQTIDEGLKHYFTYERCENINEFYESDLFYQAEKQFSKMYKTDLEACFESIRIDDLSEAVFGREMRECTDSFVQKFAELQESIRTGKGIVIGPEFSRIYAEMILQYIEDQLGAAMLEKGYVRGEDYVFYRYVDDGFLFYNDNELQEIWENLYVEQLSKFGLQLNEEKKKIYSQRPFVDNIATIKGKIADLINEMWENRLDTFMGFTKMQRGEYDTPGKIDSARFIRQYRYILQTGNGEIEYKDIAVYTLGLIRNHVDQIKDEFNELYRQYTEADITGTIDEQGAELKKQYEREFLDYMQNVVKIVFFILSCDLRMVTSMHVVSLVHSLQLYVRGVYQYEDNKKPSCRFPHNVAVELDEVISDEIRALFDSNVRKIETSMELLNLLDLQRLMIPNLHMSEQAMVRYVYPRSQFKDLNFFVIFEILHYIDSVPLDKFARLRQYMYNQISSQIRRLKSRGKSYTESVLTCAEMLCSPRVGDGIKRKILTYLGVPEEKIESTIGFIKKQNNMFITWRNYKIDHEILQFENNNVY